ncbi:hypothetical protein GW17_00000796 [Ensete ventricosum]|nr:hypothetical protein GW17_00000796 [Ensete ventricosum]
MGGSDPSSTIRPTVVQAFTVFYDAPDDVALIFLPVRGDVPSPHTRNRLLTIDSRNRLLTIDFGGTAWLRAVCIPVCTARSYRYPDRPLPGSIAKIDRRRSIEGEKGKKKKKKKRKRRRKDRGKKHRGRGGGGRRAIGWR